MRTFALVSSATLWLLMTIAVVVITVTTSNAFIHNDLHRLYLSHFSFHSDDFKIELARFVTPLTKTQHDCIVIIVGVEWGMDVAALANDNFQVIAVESNKHHADELRKKAKLKENRDWNVKVITAYAGSVVDHDHVTLDSIVNGNDSIVLLSIDVQGAELDVLRGAQTLLASPIPSVRSLWVESIACQASALHVLHMLEPHYELFDFVPWGQRNGEDIKDVPITRNSFLPNVERPGDIDLYWQWLCDNQRANYRWLQTDILAVRKDLATKEFRKNLANIHRLCINGAAYCVLRTFLSEEIKSEL